MFRHCGHCREISGRSLGGSGWSLGVPQVPLGASLGALGGSLGIPWGPWGLLGGPLRAPGPPESLRSDPGGARGGAGAPQNQILKTFSGDVSFRATVCCFRRVRCRKRCKGSLEWGAGVRGCRGAFASPSQRFLLGDRGDLEEQRKTRKRDMQETL